MVSDLMPRMEQNWILKEKLGAYDAEVWTKKLKSLADVEIHLTPVRDFS